MRALPTVFCALATMAVLAGVASAAHIPITNGDFEDESNAPWLFKGQAGTIGLPYQDMDETGHGSRIAWINGTACILQAPVGPHVVEADMIYTLSVDVGKSGVAPQYYSTTRMEVGGIDAADYRPLEAGVFLANDEPNAGEWSTWVRQWTTGADSAALGMPLAVLIVGGGGIQTLFDNVRLDVTPVPEPGALLLLATGLLGVLTRRKRRQK